MRPRKSLDQAALLRRSADVEQRKMLVPRRWFGWSLAYVTPPTWLACEFAVGNNDFATNERV